MDKIICVYKITSPSNKVYIGQTLNYKRRLYIYSILSCKRQLRLYNSFLKYGFENHTFEIIEECSINLLNEHERYWQEFYDVLEKNGLNCKLTKTEDKKLVMSDEIKQKINNTNKGMVFSKETILKRSLSLKGKSKPKRTKKHCLNISKAKKGKITSKEHKEKISKSLNERYKIQKFQSKRCKKVIHTHTGQIFNSMKDAWESYYKDVLKYSNFTDMLTNDKRKNKTNFKLYDK